MSAGYDTITDDSWVRQAFLLPKGGVTDDDMYYRKHSSSYYKFTDTTFGGNWATNAPPQPCLFSDPIIERFVNVGEGQGHWYSENIDDNAVLLHMRLGTPAYNSLSSFFSNFYSADDARLVRTGRASGIGALIGKALGWAFSIRLVPLILTFSAIKWFTGTVSTKFYYLTPRMGLFWKYLNDWTNNVASNMDMAAAPTADSWIKFSQSTNLNGSAPIADGPDTASSIEAAAANSFQIGASEKSFYDQMIPEVFRSRDLTGIDVYAVSTRAQAYADAWHNGIQEIAANNSGGSGTGLVTAIYNWMTFGGATAALNKAKTKTYATTEDFLTAYFADPDGKINSSDTSSSTAGDTTANTAAVAPVVTTDANGNAISTPSSTTDTVISAIEKAYESAKDYFSDGVLGSAIASFKAAQHDGAQWISFRVDGRQSANESFSNSVRESDIASSINSASDRARNLRFSAADGNAIPGMDTLINFASDIAAGVMDSLHISGVGVLMGNAFVDIPKHWDTSNATFNQMSLSIPLRAWCADNFNRFQNEIYPMLALLVAALPRATGTGSYTAPFIGEFYCQGRCAIPLGMITAIDITRGTSNIPWTRDGEYMGVDIRLTITDMSSVVAMNMNEAFGLRNLDPTTWNRLLFPQDSSFEMYTNVLSSMGLQQQIYQLPRFKRNWNRVTTSFNKFFTYDNAINSLFSGNVVGQILSVISRTDRGN